MRPPILFLTVAFGVGLWAGLDPFVFAGAALWGVALPLIAAAACLAARAPLGAAVGTMGGAGARPRFPAGAGGGRAGSAAVVPAADGPASNAPKALPPP